MSSGIHISNHPFPTTVVGSYPQPDWLVNREVLKSIRVPRIRAPEIWRPEAQFLEAAQDDATILAIRAMETAGIDIITDGEIRRESYSNRFALMLDGVDADNPAEIVGRTGTVGKVPRVVGPIRRTAPVDVRDAAFLCANTKSLADGAELARRRLSQAQAQIISLSAR